MLTSKKPEILSWGLHVSTGVHLCTKKMTGNIGYLLLSVLFSSNKATERGQMISIELNEFIFKERFSEINDSGCPRN